MAASTIKRSYLAALSILVSVTGCASGPETVSAGLPETVRAFIDDNGWDLGAYADSDLSDLSAYYRHERVYLVDAAMDVLWDLYANIDPRLAWRTDKTRFGAVWDPILGFMYREADDGVPPFAPGQVLVLELRLAGFYRLPVAFRIREIDRASGVIEFVYLEANKSKGKQRLEFAPAIGPGGERRSTIRHSTWYRSGDEFRDERLYGGFHASIIDAFHRAVVESAGYSIAVVES